MDEPPSAIASLDGTLHREGSCFTAEERAPWSHAPFDVSRLCRANEFFFRSRVRSALCPISEKLVPNSTASMFQFCLCERMGETDSAEETWYQ